MYHVKSLKPDFSSRDDVFLPEDVQDDFQFKYIPVNEFKNVMKKRLQSMSEEKKWNSFVQKQMSELIAEETCSRSERCEKLENNAKPLHLEHNLFAENGKYVLRCNAATSEKNFVCQESDSDEIQVKDMLLTIPEEDATPSPEPTSHYKKTYRKPEKLNKKKSRHKTFRHSLENSEYESEKSTSYTGEKHLKPNPIVVHKIQSIRRKISELLEEIALRIEKIPIPDGDNDFLRRQQRVSEFSARFSRNYLYELGRFMVDIRHHVGAISPVARILSTKRDFLFHMHSIEQKLISAYQLLLNSFNTYCKHIHSSVVKGQPGKLGQLLDLVVELASICQSLGIQDEHVCQNVFQEKQMEDLCSEILSKLRVNLDDESQRTSQAMKSSARNSSSVKRRNYLKRARNRNYLGSKIERGIKLGKEKKNTVAHQMQQNHFAPKVAYPTEISARKEFLRPSAAKMRVAIKEDEIKTIVDTIASDTDESNTESPIRLREMNKDIRRIDERFKNTVMKITEEQLSQMMPAFNEFMEEYKKNEVKTGSQQKVATNIIDSDLKQLFRTRNKEGNIQTIGLSKSSPRVEKNDGPPQNLEPNESPKSQKPFGTPLIVSQVARKNLFEYQSAFENSLKSIPMYCDTRNKPWDLVSRIADKLVEELITSFCENLEMKSDINNMYDQEFREY